MVGAVVELVLVLSPWEASSGNDDEEDEDEEVVVVVEEEYDEGGGGGGGDGVGILEVGIEASTFPVFEVDMLG